MIKKITILLFLVINLAINANDKPDFSLIDTNGNKHTKTSTNGKFLVVNFWATWCPPCIKEMPEFIEFYEKYNKKVEFLGMNNENDEEKVKEFTESLFINYPIIIAKNQEVEFFKFEHIYYLPTTLIYDKDGKLMTNFTGILSQKQLKEIMRL